RQEPPQGMPLFFPESWVREEALEEVIEDSPTGVCQRVTGGQGSAELGVEPVGRLPHLLLGPPGEPLLRGGLEDVPHEDVRTRERAPRGATRLLFLRGFLFVRGHLAEVQPQRLLTGGRQLGGVEVDLREGPAHPVQSVDGRGQREAVVEREYGEG